MYLFTVHVYITEKRDYWLCPEFSDVKIMRPQLKK